MGLGEALAAAKVRLCRSTQVQTSMPTVWAQMVAHLESWQAATKLLGVS